ncbi:MAG: NUDIX domain-containing protein [Solirubrobacterales bacterium]|nr:NUDIX domain-containing protein [Solirubrobacterales bacterium]
MDFTTFLPVRARRWAIRSAYRALRVYWYLRRPATSGVKCVLRTEDRLLLVRHTYGRDDWDFPGGAMKSGEAPAHAARREIREELGVTIDDWRELGVVTGRADYRRDTLHCFQAPLVERQLALDGGEIAAAGWFERGALPANLGRYVPPILALLED